MGKWKNVKLGDCIKEVVEKTTKNNQHQVLSVTKNGIFSQEEFFKKQIASDNNIGYKVIRRNNLVFSTMNLWMGSLDVLTNYDIGIVSPSYKIFKFNETIMLPSYGNYFMKSYYMLEQYKNYSEQGASVVRRNLELKALLNIDVFIPPIDEQEKIVKILEKVDLIIEKYKKILEEKNQYIKSQFVEMFGNPKTNSMKLEKRKIKDFANCFAGATPSTVVKEYWENGTIPWMSSGEVNLEHVYATEKKITQKGYDSSSTKLIPKHTVVVALAGQGKTRGKVAITEIELCTNQSLCAIIIDKTFVEADYLYYYLKMQYEELRKSSYGDGGRGGLNLQIIGNFEVIIPDIMSQKKFIKIVELIDKQKFWLEKIVENYKNLKKGLMQQLLTGKVEINV